MSIMGTKNVAIIGASYLQVPLIRKAQELGYTTHVFAWAANDVGETAADHFYPISITEVDQITEKCREIGISGVCSIASDLASVTVNYVADKLGLVGNTMDSAYKSSNKHLMRLAFEAGGDPSPKSVLVDEKTDLDSLYFSYPIIVKPTDRSGSRGICKLESAEGIKDAVYRAMNEGFEKKALIEEYAEGQEYSVEGISYNGNHTILAMTLKYTTGAPHFIETGHIEPAPVDKDTFNRVCAVVKHALDSLGIQYGASHSEIKIDDQGNIKIIEIGGRMGGDCIGSDLVYYSTGIDYVKAVLQISVGEKPDLEPKTEGFAVSSHFIFTEKDVAEMEAIRKNRPDDFLKLVFFREELLNKTTNSSDRAGCYIIRENAEGKA